MDLPTVRLLAPPLVPLKRSPGRNTDPGPRGADGLRFDGRLMTGNRLLPAPKESVDSWLMASIMPLNRSGVSRSLYPLIERDGLQVSPFWDLYASGRRIALAVLDVS